MRKVKVTIQNNEYEYEVGVSYEQIVKDFQKDYDVKIVLVSANGRLRELHKILSNDCTLEFITIAEKIGMETYRRSATFLLVKAVHDVIGDDSKNHIVAQYTVGRGLLCKLVDIEPTEQFLRSVHARMDELISQNIPIWKTSYSVDEARRFFAEAGMEDKVRLFKYRRASKVNVYSIGDYKDYYYGYMVPSTGYITHYDLYTYEDGIILQLPSRHSPNVVPDRTDSPKLQKALQATSDWGESIGIENVGDLNEMICNEGMQDVVLLQEAHMESRIAEIAKDIVAKGGRKFIMIAGPSSSGKTSFSYRLSIQLHALGLRPHPIALDNYFKNREDTPKDENGEYDFECLEAIDIEQFNQDMLKLLAGETVELPTFNFKTGQREYKGDYRRLDENDILVIEGIHGLNEKMSYALPAESKYKVYISALTALNVDEHNRIATTDVRLLRRMVRDNRTRGTSASGTLNMWRSVRRGEEKYIFPFQESADAVFNSALIYELSVLKLYAEPLLFGISKEDPQYYEAKRLLKFLDYFLGVTSEGLPNNSLIREFVGGSIFNV
ncbi:MAG: nucleoside kinase [Lachnospiraceae bacterium]|nr:nucleoside kinase [Lachnospiraceae bacterium]